MFEELFPGPIALVRHRTSPLADERRQFLRHLRDLGYARLSLKAVGCELVVITRYLDLSGGEALDVAVVEAAARRWAADQIRRHHGTNLQLSTRNFRYWAEQWLRWLGRLRERPPVAAPAFQPLLDGFKAYMADEQGLTPLSIRSHAWKTEKFLAWYWPQGRAIADVTIQDVDAFLTVKGRATWSRRSVAIAVQALRAFFRYAERTRSCRAGIAAALVGPPLYNLESLPAGRPWADVEAIIGLPAAPRADHRDVAAQTSDTPPLLSPLDHGRARPAVARTHDRPAGARNLHPAHLLGRGTASPAGRRRGESETEGLHDRRTDLSHIAAALIRHRPASGGSARTRA